MINEELQVYDIVRIDGVVGEVKRDNIYSILCGEYEVTPIELTEDMLTSNGFQKIGYGIYSNGNVNVNIYKDKMSFSFSKDTKTINHFNIKYVHQLQHLMRICGDRNAANNMRIKI